jgi:exosortase
VAPAARALARLLNRRGPSVDDARPAGTAAIGSRPAVLASALIGLALAGLYGPVLTHAVGVWRLDEELSFGFLLPAVAAMLVWLRWHALRSTQASSADLGLGVLVLGLVLFVTGLRSGVHALAGASFLPTALGAVAYLRGWAAARLLFVPTAFLTAGLSLFRGLFAPLGFVLQELTAGASATLATLAGMHVRRSGMDLFVGDAHFVVAQACSGMDSLLALLSLSLLVVALASGRASSAAWPRRALLVLLVVPVVLIANVLRVTAVLALSQPFGTAIAVGLPHQALSAAVFLFASLAMWFACVGLRCLPRFAVTPSPAS